MINPTPGVNQLSTKPDDIFIGAARISNWKDLFRNYIAFLYLSENQLGMEFHVCCAVPLKIQV
jgi:hypothetical protein